MLKQDIENKIINHFEKRTISPKEELWSKIELELDNTEESTHKYSFTYRSIAAILIIFIAVIFIIKLDLADNSNKTVASLDLKVNPAIEKVSTKFEENPEIAQIAPNVLLSQKTNSTVSKNTSKLNNRIISPLPTFTKVENDITVIASVESGDVVNVNQTIDQSYTEDKIDPTLLLQQVESEIKTNKSTKLSNHHPKSYGVSAKNLLADAEKESDKRFYAKVFKSVQEASGQIYTAVSNRNIAK